MLLLLLLPLLEKRESREGRVIIACKAVAIREAIYIKGMLSIVVKCNKINISLVY